MISVATCRHVRKPCCRDRFRHEPSAQSTRNRQYLRRMTALPQREKTTPRVFRVCASSSSSPAVPMQSATATASLHLRSILLRSWVETAPAARLSSSWRRHRRTASAARLHLHQPTALCTLGMSDNACRRCAVVPALTSTSRSLSDPRGSAGSCLRVSGRIVGLHLNLIFSGFRRQWAVLVGPPLLRHQPCTSTAQEPP